MIDRVLEALSKPKMQMTAVDELVLAVPVLLLLAVGAFFFWLFFLRRPR